MTDTEKAKSRERHRQSYIKNREYHKDRAMEFRKNNVELCADRSKKDYLIRNDGWETVKNRNQPWTVKEALCVENNLTIPLRELTSLPALKNRSYKAIMHRKHRIIKERNQ